MYKGIRKWWQSLVGGTPTKALAAATDLPPLADPDFEYLFMQLLEGVSHGWQQPRAIEFFRKIRQRAPKSQWLAWLNGYGDRVLNEPAPNEEIARRMIQLSELDCGEVTALAGDYGHQILGKIYGTANDEYLTEISADELEELGFTIDSMMPEDFQAIAIPENFAEDADLEYEPTEVDLAGQAQDQELDIAANQDWAATSNAPMQIFSLDDLELDSFAEAESQAAEAIPETQHSQALSEDFSAPPQPLYKSRQPLADLVDNEDDNFPTFGEVPEELRLGSASKKTLTPPPPPLPSGFFHSDLESPQFPKATPDLSPPLTTQFDTQMPPSGFLQPIDFDATVDQPDVEQREISIEEFAVMLQSDPELVRDISQQLGIDTQDPQVVFDTVVAQMQMQEQSANGQQN
jgi:hypothetical protein